LIDLIRITSELKEVIQPTYYFEIKDSDMDAIRDGRYDIMLKMAFVEDKETKSAKVNVNGREFNVYQTQREFKKNLNDYVVEGNNAAKVMPETTMEIMSLEVVKE
ncbi:TPA: hypothetical protein HA265_06480, partial [Candidatus Woesearchaeota archaeon]|nr:hypothetical protein [Candidatus Woesearchaeota archaeon]